MLPAPLSRSCARSTAANRATSAAVYFRANRLRRYTLGSTFPSARYIRIRRRDLRHTQSDDLAYVASNLTLLLLALTGVLLHNQHPLRPGIPFGPVLSTEFDPIAGLQKLADLARGKVFGILHLQ